MIEEEVKDSVIKSIKIENKREERTLPCGVHAAVLHHAEKESLISMYC